MNNEEGWIRKINCKLADYRESGYDVKTCQIQKCVYHKKHKVN